MHDVAAGEYPKGFDDLSEEEQCAFFWEGAFLLHEFVKGAAVAVLIDEVEVISSLEHVDVFDDVGAGLEC